MYNNNYTKNTVYVYPSLKQLNFQVFLHMFLLSKDK